MKEWFKAFATQDPSVRDYRKYFVPVLCYLEGSWTLNTDEIKEPFDSDRHHLDSQTWWDMQVRLSQVSLDVIIVSLSVTRSH